MTRLDVPRLNAELRRLRNLSTNSHGAKSPCVSHLNKVLMTLSDLNDRFIVYGLLGGESRLDGDFEGALTYAEAGLAEFGDIPSHCRVAKSLFDLGRYDEAVKVFLTTFALAIEANKLVNYIFGEFMRASVKMKDGTILNRTSREFLSLKREQSREDCALETDWVAAGELVGLDKKFADRIYSLAVKPR